MSVPDTQPEPGDSTQENASTPEPAPVTIQRMATIQADGAAPFVVPDHVAAGLYRAVNHHGETRIVVVPKASGNASAAARDFYTQEAGQERWYLIRLDVSLAATIEKSVERR